MEIQPFKAFVALINFDQKIKELQRQVSGLQESVDKLDEQEEAALFQADKIHQNALELRKQVDAQELEMKDLDTQEKAKRLQLDTITDQRSYESLQKEINGLKSAQHNSEKVLLGVWNKLEVAQNEWGAVQKQQEGLLQKIRSDKAELQQQIEAINAEVANFEQQRPEKKELVNQEWLERYEAMRSRVDDPVVSIHGDSCGACFGALTSQDVMRLKRRALLPCKSCFRLLYDEKAMEHIVPPSDKLAAS